MASKKFGFWTLTFLVIANMVGAGLFTTSGFALGDLGSPSLVVAAWGVGGVIALMGAFSYGMLVRALPESGGEYLFLARAIHPLLGFIAGWVSLIAGFSGAMAFAATAFEGYLVPQAARPNWLPEGAVGLGTILVAGFFHGMKPRVGAVVQNGVVLLKLGLLATMLLYAASQLKTGDWPGFVEPETGLKGWSLISTFATSLVWISLSYAGFNAAVYIAGEVDDAGQTVPKALMVGTTIVLVLYVLLNAVFVYSAPPESIQFKQDVAAISARSLGGVWFEVFVRGTIATCLLTSIFSMMMAAPRVYAKMADDGMMPRALQFQGETPLAATVLQVLLASFLVLASDLRGLLSYLGLTLSLSSACSVASLFSPAIRTRPILHRIHVIPAIYVACTVLSALIMATIEPRQLVGTLLTFSIGGIVYLAVRAT